MTKENVNKVKKFYGLETQIVTDNNQCGGFPVY